MKKYRLGYTQGVFDMFHIGHLNLINRAKEYCDQLIVGVNSDILVKDYKKKITVIPENERAIIVSNIKAVDKCIIVNTLDKEEIFKQLHFDAVFIGDDWAGDIRWIETEQRLKRVGVDVVFLPYTQNVSSTILRLEKEYKIDE